MGDTNARDRLHFLDGLRGWAALAVVLYHLFVEGFPISRTIADTLFRVPLFNGNLAVCIFFVVSGFALSAHFVHTQDRRALARMAIGRYARLAIPIAAACAIVFALLKLGLMTRWHEAPAPFNAVLTYDPSLWDLVYFSFWGVFFNYSAAASFIGPLWTMPIELMGSLAVFACLAVLGGWRYRLPAYIAVFFLIAAHDAFYSLFVAGMIAAELLAMNKPKLNTFAAVTLLVLGLGMASVSFRSIAGVKEISATILIFTGAVTWNGLRDFLSNRTSRFLGRISFPLYLIHGPLLFVVSLPLHSSLQAVSFDAAGAKLIVCVVTLPLSILASLALVPVNDFAMRVSRSVGLMLVPAINRRETAAEGAPRSNIFNSTEQATPTTTRAPVG